LKAAVARGVSVNALIAYANRGGEKNLRKLEMRLLESGVTVSRSSNDLSRYHDKLLLIDGKDFRPVPEFAAGSALASVLLLGLFILVARRRRASA